MNSLWHKASYTVAYSPAETPRSRWLWLTPYLVLLGVLGTVGIIVLAEQHGQTIALVAPLIVPVSLALLIFGVSRTWHVARRLLTQLRWWHILWLLVFASALVFRIRSANEIDTDPLDAWALYRVALDLIVAAVLVVRLGLRRTPWLGSMFRGFLGLLTLFAVVCLASTAWSVFPAWTLFKSAEYLLDIALLAAILETVQSLGDFESLFNWTWALYGLLLLSVWLGALLWPQDALYSHWLPRGALLGMRLCGVLPAQASEGVGIFAAMLALICAARLMPLSGTRRDRFWYILALLGCLATMVLTQTRGAFAGFLFGLLLLLYLSRRLRLSLALTFLMGPLLLLTSAGGLVWAFLERGQSEHSLTTLSSRVTWWTFAWQKFLQRPLLGFGAYAGGRFAVMAKLGLGTTSSLHSDFLGIIVGTSIWGLIPFLSVLLALWWFLLRYLRRSSGKGPERQLAYEAIAVLALLSVNSFLVPKLSWPASLYFLVIVGYAEFLRRRRATVSAPRQARQRPIPFQEPAHHGAAV